MVVGMNPMTVLSNRVRELRHARGLDQQALAERAGISMQTVSNLETGRLRDLKVSTLAALGNALGVSSAELLAHEGHPASSSGNCS
jgi:transcriptional regulator with XRE-family HTH domain